MSTLLKVTAAIEERNIDYRPWFGPEPSTQAIRRAPAPAPTPNGAAPLARSAAGVAARRTGRKLLPRHQGSGEAPPQAPATRIGRCGNGVAIG